MFVLLEEDTTLLGRQTAHAARRLGFRVLRLTPEDIVHRVEVCLRIDQDRPHVELHGAGWSLCGDDCAGVLCLFDTFSPALFTGFGPRDADYAARETQALWLAILSALPCLVINPPAPDALGGAARSPAEVARMALSVGLLPSSVAYVESGRAAEQLHRAGVCADFHDLSRSPGHPSGSAGDAFDVSGPVMVHERAPGDRTWVCLLGETPHVVGTADSPPDDVLDRLLALQRALGVHLGTYAFVRSHDGSWRLDRVRRRPHAALVAALGGSFFRAVAAFFCHSAVETPETWSPSCVESAPKLLSAC